MVKFGSLCTLVRWVLRCNRRCCNPYRLFMNYLPPILPLEKVVVLRIFLQIIAKSQRHSTARAHFIRPRLDWVVSLHSAWHLSLSPQAERANSPFCRENRLHRTRRGGDHADSGLLRTVPDFVCPPSPRRRPRSATAGARVHEGGRRARAVSAARQVRPLHPRGHGAAEEAVLHRKRREGRLLPARRHRHRHV